jgi:Holliday junction resolvase-like predicted endonuclease
MTHEKDIIVSVLKLTKTGTIQKEILKKDAHVSVQVLDEMLTKLSEARFIRQQRDLVEASPNQRVSMAVHAIQLGADFEQICKLLEWTEFESITAQAFHVNGFRVLKNFRFKHSGKRWEIDVISCREPLIVCVDCKHWRRGLSQAATVKAVEAQVERTRAFADALPNYYQKAQLTEWKSATLVPLVLSLVPGPFKFHSSVPIVPALQLQSFISELPFEVNSLTHFDKKLLIKDKKLTDYSQ